MDEAWAKWEALSKAEGKRKQPQEEVYVELPLFPCWCGETRRLCLPQIQLRSADELAASFYRCAKGHVVKYN